MKRLILMLVASCFAACGSNSTETPEAHPKDPIDIPDQPALPVFSANGGSSSYRFTAKTNWTAGVTATRAADWCSISPTSGGKGDVILSIVTKPNDTPDERNATITLRAGEASKSFSVTQKQKDALTVTSAKIELEAAGGTATVEVKANISFEYEIGADCKEWVTYSGTRAMQTSRLEFKVAENDDTALREGTITIRSSEGSETIKIYQAGGAPTLVLTQKEYTVGSAGETIRVEIKSNVDYDVTMPQASWITESETRAMSTHTRYYAIAPNEDYDARSAEIVFKDKNSSLTQKVTITQVQKDAIVLAKSEYEFGADGGALDFEVMTNVTLNVAVSQDAQNWIKQVQTRGLEPQTLHFDIAACGQNTNRIGTITVSGGGISQVVTIRQNGMNEIRVKERQALVSLFNATNGSSWTNSTNWCSDKPLNEWFGIAVTDNGCIKSIDLTNNNLTGNLPDELGDFSFMTSLYLDSNRGLTGALPKTMGKLINLSYLQISNCNLTGSLPTELFSQTQLSVVKLKGNKLTGTIPASFSNVLERYRQSLTSREWPLRNNTQAASGVARTMQTSAASLVSPAEGSYDFTTSLLFGNYSEEDSYDYMDCDFDPYIQLERNNFSGEIPRELAENPLWQKSYLSYLTLYQNTGYGFNLQSTNLGIPDHVKFNCNDGEVFTPASCAKQKYTMLCITSDAELIKLCRKYKQNLRVYRLIHSGSLDNTPDLIKQYGLNWNVAYGLGSPAAEYVMCFKSTFATLKYPLVMLFDERAKLVFHAAGDNTEVYNALDAFLYAHGGPDAPDKPLPNQIYYTTTDEKIVTPTPFDYDLKILSNTYTDRGIITCEKPIKEIETELFRNCKRLKSIILPEGLTLIDGTQWPDNGAFERCPDLEKVVLPSSLTTLNNRAFAYCPKLTDITLPPNLTKIGGAAFMGCSSLTSISIPSRITTIEANLFTDCTALESVSLPEGVLEIGFAAFSRCRSLTGCTLPASLQSLGSNAFTECSALKSIVIPDGFTSKIDYIAFKNCSALEHVVIGNGVSAIDNEAFMNCSSLAELVIGSKVASIGMNAFKGCSSLRRLRIPDSVTTIGWEAFRGCSSLSQTTLGSSVTDVAENAFRDCTGHLFVNCDTDYEKFKNAFTGNRFTSIEFGENPTVIGAYLFQNSTLLEAITIGKQVKTIAPQAFRDCSKLSQVIFPKQESQLVEIRGGVFQQCTSLNHIDIPSSVTTIGDATFVNCTNLVTINLPQSITAIGTGAFENCVNLESIVLPPRLTVLSGRLLFGCAKIRNLIIPANVTEIGSSALRRCNSLTSITIPKKVQKLGLGAFGDCSSLLTVYCRPSTPPTYEPYPFTIISEKFRIYVPIGHLSEYADRAWYYYHDYIYGYNFTD